MVFADDLPGDSVLRRHALTERHRSLGLPPTDSVLRRHYEQLMGVAGGSEPAPAVATPGAATPAAAPARPAAAASSAPASPASSSPASSSPASSSPASSIPAPQAAGGGGFFGWLRRLLGA
jgi:hypothetical protein